MRALTHDELATLRDLASDGPPEFLPDDADESVFESLVSMDLCETFERADAGCAGGTVVVWRINEHGRRALRCAL